jgi:hypothetical protein
MQNAVGLHPVDELKDPATLHRPDCRAALAIGSGPYFYLPKMESHLEARLWNDAFNLAQGGWWFKQQQQQSNDDGCYGVLQLVSCAGCFACRRRGYGLPAAGLSMQLALQPALLSRHRLLFCWVSCVCWRNLWYHSEVMCYQGFV